jgi:hypothetical protein
MAAEQSAAGHEQAAALREPGKATAITRAPRASKTTASKPTRSIKSAKSPVAMAGEDPMRVAEALRALRKEGDPERAQGLLADYLKTNPRGALSEEALALTIEAAHTRADPRAKAYARRYMARYPQGRHQALAQRVLKQ